MASSNIVAFPSNRNTRQPAVPTQRGQRSTPLRDSVIDDLTRIPEQVALAWRQRIASEANFYEAYNRQGPL